MFMARTIRYAELEGLLINVSDRYRVINFRDWMESTAYRCAMTWTSTLKQPEG